MSVDAGKPSRASAAPVTPLWPGHATPSLTHPSGRCSQFHFSADGTGAAEPTTPNASNHLVGDPDLAAGVDRDVRTKPATNRR
jgi:hypothetical protein